MTSSIEANSRQRVMAWVGWVVTILPVLLLVMSGVMKLLQPPEVVEGFAKFGYPQSIAPALAIVELTCTLLYVVPHTSMLGAILLTGYLGGATATHVRINDAYFVPVVIGVLVWGGLYLREPRLRAILPLRR